jgi:hypothetical protein
VSTPEPNLLMPPGPTCIHTLASAHDDRDVRPCGWLGDAETRRTGVSHPASPDELRTRLQEA